MAKGRAWTREELVVAMNLYCTMEFGQFHARNPVIVEVAAKLDRSPSSLAMKLCNFASLDPFHAARGVSGLSGASQLDREVWLEFHHDWEKSAYESEVLLAKTKGVPLETEIGIEESELPKEGRERERVVRVRVNQHFFRASILAAYESACCITGLDAPELLVASHVVPWARNASARVNPRNGLCLNALHDRAFDRGLITVSDEFRVVLSPRLHQLAETPAAGWLQSYGGAPIRLPQRFKPEPEFLAWHREHVFLAD